jgi:uncharacterized protein YukE
MPTFFDQRKSLPSAYQANAGVALAAAGESLMFALQQFRKTTEVSASWTGSAARSHEDRTAKLADAASRVIQAIAQAGTLTSSGATRMQVLKTQNDATVASAMSAQYLVMPTGQVVPGPAHYAKATGPHGPALMKMFWMIARLYSGQITANVGQSTATDAQVAAQLAVVAIEFFSDLLDDRDTDGNAPVMPAAPGGYVPGTPAPVQPIEYPAWTLPATTPGSALAGAGALGGAGISGPGGIGLGGGAGIGGAGMGGAGLGGAAGAGVPMAAGLMGGGGAGGSAAGAGAAGAAGGRGMAGGGMAGGAGAGMMPMGAGMGGRGQDSAGSSDQTWLQEDRDPFAPDDEAPDAVLS